MAPIAAELPTLRTIIFRLSDTSTSQLPQQVPSIAGSLANCRSLLSSNQASGPKTSSEASVAVHKYRTLLSTLLQDRTPSGRWAAIVLIKATVEIGGWETLQKSLPWVRVLLGILMKPDAPSSKKLCIITLTRIFALTREYPTLVRVITTPSLPTFVQTCLQLAPNAPASLLQTILESFNQLLPRHPTIFRSYLKQLNQLFTQTIAPTPSSKVSSEQGSSPRYEMTLEVSTAAQQLYTQLPNSAPKGASNEEWQASLKKTVENAHRVADKVFRAVVEDWRPSINNKKSTNGHTLEDEVQDVEPDIMTLSPWSGIYAGGERLVSLMRLVGQYLACTTAGPITLEVGAIADLLTRVLSLNVPSSSGSKDLQNYVKFNNQVSKEERENLWVILPEIHVAAIEVLLALSRRGGDSSTSVDAIMLDQLAMVFSSGKDTAKIRTACYLAIAQLLERSGPALPKSSVEPLSSIIRGCCDDILPVETNNTPSKQPSQQGKANGTYQQNLTNADAFLSSSKSVEIPAAHFKGLQEAARTLLVVLYSSIPHHLSDSLRTRMDRTATLTCHKNALLTSYLNVAPSKKFGKPAASVLPLLARLHAGEREVEALVRPRMPVIRIGGQGVEEDDMSEADEAEEEGEAHDDEEDAEPFVGHELDTLLETASKTDNSEATAMIEVADEVPLMVTGTSLNGTRHSTSERTIHTTALEEVEPIKNGGKRPQETDAPLSPTKRFKIGEGSSSTLLPTPPSAMPTVVSITQTTTASGPSEENLYNGPTGATTTQVSAASPTTTPAAKAPGDEDSDDEDMVPLILGQDTDDESE